LDFTPPNEWPPLQTGSSPPACPCISPDYLSPLFFCYVIGMTDFFLAEARSSPVWTPSPTLVTTRLLFSPLPLAVPSQSSRCPSSPLLRFSDVHHDMFFRQLPVNESSSSPDSPLSGSPFLPARPFDNLFRLSSGLYSDWGVTRRRILSSPPAIGYYFLAPVLLM